MGHPECYQISTSKSIQALGLRLFTLLSLWSSLASPGAQHNFRPSRSRAQRARRCWQQLPLGLRAPAAAGSSFQICSSPQQKPSPGSSKHDHHPPKRVSPDVVLCQVLQWKHKSDRLQLRTGKKWLYRDSAEIKSALFVKECYLKETNFFFFFP